MASLYHRLLDPREMAADKKQNREEVLDVGSLRQLLLQLRVLSARSGGT